MCACICVTVYFISHDIKNGNCVRNNCTRRHLAIVSPHMNTPLHHDFKSLLLLHSSAELQRMALEQLCVKEELLILLVCGAAAV